MTTQQGVRLPGARRVEHRGLAAQEGVEVPDDLMAVLRGWADRA